MNPINIGFAALAHQAELKRAWELAQPIVNAYQRAAPELVPLMTNLLIAFGVIEDQKPAEYLVAFNTRWLQESLKVLADPHLVVDGRLGPATKSAVRKFQQLHPPLAVDGWPGVQTCATIAIEMEKLK